MNPVKLSPVNTRNDQSLVCPNLLSHWKIISVPESEQGVSGFSPILLQGIKTRQRFPFSLTEGYALKLFNGKLTVRQVQEKCQQQFGKEIHSDFVIKLLEKLVALGVLGIHKTENKRTYILREHSIKPNRWPLLKSAVQWIWNPNGYWLLRMEHPHSLAYLQISPYQKNLLLQLGKLPPKTIAAKYQVNIEDIQFLLKKLAGKGMLKDVKPVQSKRSWKFKKLLFNKNTWFDLQSDKINFIFTQKFSLLICILLAFVVAISVKNKVDKKLVPVTYIDSEENLSKKINSNSDQNLSQDIIPAKKAQKAGVIIDGTIKIDFAKQILEKVKQGTLRQEVATFLIAISATESSGGNWQEHRPNSKFYGAFQISRDRFDPNISDEEILGNPDMQIEVAQKLYDEKVVILADQNNLLNRKTLPEQQPLIEHLLGKSELYQIAYAWITLDGIDGHGVYSQDFASAAEQSAEIIRNHQYIRAYLYTDVK
ncbi:hypothetical protein VB713_12275 [Anabaena cylindrica UHCC 0172]|uniref:hypothetical protein n=1 Tax=Anabaena cylindrica TaxID=1165 RepID=UPI002B213678|nr:hypothetical protein [Anabaena cylindrica]MEA5551748.1 hypothetical protein [Anabaena cylindrica UHCC 0172]